MATIAPLKPSAIRELLTKQGYKLVAQDAWNWVFVKGNDDAPVIVPFAVDVVPLEVAQDVLAKVGFESYADAIHQQGDPWPASTDSKTTH